MIRSWMRQAGGTGALVLALGPAARSQTAVGAVRSEVGAHGVAGAVLDATGAPVAFASIRVLAANGWRNASTSDGAGHFAVASVPFGPAQIEVRRLGFRPVTTRLTISSADGAALDSTRFVLEAIAVELSSIDVSDSRDGTGALDEFYGRRRTNNFGHYLDRADIEATHAQRPSDALRGVPGLLIQPSRRIGNIIRIRNCRPTIWIDGIRVPDAELDEVASVDDVAAVEIYKSLAGLPQQFIDRTNPCGGILIWSRHH